MLRKTKKQNYMSSLFEADELQKSAEIEKQEIVKEKDSKPTIGSFRETGKQNISNGFFGLDELTKSAEIAEKVSKAQKNEIRNNNKYLTDLAEQQKSKNLKGFDPMISNGSSIISARAGNISDMRGPAKQIKTTISNSIFDPDKNERESKEIDSKVATKIEKEIIASNKRIAEQQRMDTLIDALRTTDQTKGISVNRTGTGSSESTNFKASQNNISIFDSGDFERIPEKTKGEEVSQQVSEKKSQVDESWKQNNKSLKSREITNRFFDGLVEKL